MIVIRRHFKFNEKRNISSNKYNISKIVIYLYNSKTIYYSSDLNEYYIKDVKK